MESPLNFSYHLIIEEKDLLITSFTTLFISLGALLLLLFCARKTLRLSCSDKEHLAPILNSKDLAPAEIAYLLRGGDVTHTLIVVAVDLLQRNLKSANQELLAPYEKNMWEIVTRSAKEWAMQKTQETVMAGAKTPLQITRRVMFLYTFIRRSLKSVVSDTIADPRKLKRYFSPHGLLRILADFTSAGYKQAFQEEIRKDLLARGLLIPEAKRVKTGQIFFVVALVGLALAFAASIICTKGSNSWAGAVTFVIAMSAGFLARLALSLREMLPLYEELALVAEKVDRKSRRLQVLKFFLRSINVLFWILLFLVIAIVLGIGFGTLHIFQLSTGWNSFFELVALTVTNFVIADFVFEGWKLQIEERPTPEAEKQLLEMQKSFSEKSPLESFKDVLASADYDPTFSRLLALYGVETLFVLI